MNQTALFLQCSITIFYAFYSSSPWPLIWVWMCISSWCMGRSPLALLCMLVMFQMSSQIILTLLVLTQTTGRRELGCSIHSGHAHLLPYWVFQWSVNKCCKLPGFHNPKKQNKKNVGGGMCVSFVYISLLWHSFNFLKFL